ncbi:MAG: hypothetical protein NTW04_01940 [Elusimicrobia bacterium]|nr:hypothetical protein [Elusimicrobiota bacterium]
MKTKTFVIATLFLLAGYFTTRTRDACALDEKDIEADYLQAYKGKIINVNHKDRYIFNMKDSGKFLNKMLPMLNARLKEDASVLRYIADAVLNSPFEKFDVMSQFELNLPFYTMAAIKLNSDKNNVPFGIRDDDVISEGVFEDGSTYVTKLGLSALGDIANIKSFTKSNELASIVTPIYLTLLHEWFHYIQYLKKKYMGLKYVDYKIFLWLGTEPEEFEAHLISAAYRHYCVINKMSNPYYSIYEDTVIDALYNPTKDSCKELKNYIGIKFSQRNGAFGNTYGNLNNLSEQILHHIDLRKNETPVSNLQHCDFVLLKSDYYVYDLAEERIIKCDTASLEESLEEIKRWQDFYHPGIFKNICENTSRLIKQITNQ